MKIYYEFYRGILIIKICEYLNQIECHKLFNEIRMMVEVSGITNLLIETNQEKIKKYLTELFLKFNMNVNIQFYGEGIDKQLCDWIKNYNNRLISYQNNIFA